MILYKNIPISFFPMQSSSGNTVKHVETNTELNNFLYKPNFWYNPIVQNIC